MKYFTPYFWICLAAFTLNQGVEKAGVFVPFVHSYLDDLLCPGIVLGFALSFQQQLTFRKASYRFTHWHAIFLVFWYSLLFEVLFPYFDSHHHADIWDVVAYGCGSFSAHEMGQQTKRPPSSGACVLPFFTQAFTLSSVLIWGLKNTQQ